jgi:hypothetical protein
VFNAAIPATGPAFSYFILEREVAAGKIPKAIIYAPSPHTFASQREALLVGGFCTWPEIGEVLATRTRFSEAVYGILCKISYSLRNREVIGSFFKSRVAREVQDEYALKTPVGTDPAPRRFTVAQVLPVLKKPFAVRKFNDLMLGKFLKLARANHIPVYWVTMPVLPAVYESRKPFHFDRDYQAFLAELQDRYGIQVVQKEFLLLDDHDFVDSLHLNRPAAENFTRYLGNKLTAIDKSARP